MHGSRVTHPGLALGVAVVAISCPTTRCLSRARRPGYRHRRAASCVEGTRAELGHGDGQLIALEEYLTKRHRKTCRLRRRASRTSPLPVGMPNTSGSGSGTALGHAVT